MKILGWLKKKKTTKKMDIESYKNICPDCGGEGFRIRDNHYIADNDYSRRYSICRRCNGTGRYHSYMDNDQSNLRKGIQYPAQVNQPLQSEGITNLRACRIAGISLSLTRIRHLLRMDFIFAHILSMGFKSGLYGGRQRYCTFCSNQFAHKIAMVRFEIIHNDSRPRESKAEGRFPGILQKRSFVVPSSKVIQAN